MAITTSMRNKLKRRVPVTGRKQCNAAASSRCRRHNTVSAAIKFSNKTRSKNLSRQGTEFEKLKSSSQSFYKTPVGQPIKNKDNIFFISSNKKEPEPYRVPVFYIDSLRNYLFSGSFSGSSCGSSSVSSGSSSVSCGSFSCGSFSCGSLSCGSLSCGSFFSLLCSFGSCFCVFCFFVTTARYHSSCEKNCER